jgi:hypothetical protein
MDGFVYISTNAKMLPSAPDDIDRSRPIER